MKHWKVVVVMLLVLSMAFTAACNSDSTGEFLAEGAASPRATVSSRDQVLTAAGFPIAKEPITIHMFSAYHPAVSPDWDQLMLWQEYEKMTNIHIEWELVPASQLDERRNLMLANGDYPEVLFAANVSTLDMVKYGALGKFIPLNDLIDKHAPNVKKLLDQYPDLRKGITMPDGNIYTLPSIIDPEFHSMLANQKLWIKEDWLNQLKMDVPKTIDEFYEMLKAFKETDLNGNGKNDEIPILFRGTERFLNYLRGAWGLGNRGYRSHKYVDIDPETDQLRFIPTTPQYKEMLEFMNRLYREGIITKELFTLENNQLLMKGSQGNVGSFVGIGPSAFNGTGYVGGEVLQGPHGDRLYSGVLSPLLNGGPFIITDKAKNPEAAIRWADYFYSDEGNLMFYMGFEGITYRKTADGRYEYMDEITKNPLGLTPDQAIGRYLVWPGGMSPGIRKQATFKGTEGTPEAIAATEKLKPYFIEEIWSDFSYTIEENDEFIAYSSDIDTYVKEMQAKFISGIVPFSEWDAYVDTLYHMGLDNYMKIYEAAYKRYKNN